MRRLIKASIFVAAILAASACAVVAQTSETISAKPFVTEVAPIINETIVTIVGAAVTAALAWGVGFINAHWKFANIQISDAQMVRIKSAAKTIAMGLAAKAEDDLGNRSITTTSPEVIEGVKLLQQVVPDLLDARNPHPGREDEPDPRRDRRGAGSD